MSERGDVVVVTSCTARKLVSADDAARKGDEASGAAITAESLYVGQQHVRLMRGVHAYRAAGRPVGPLRLRILSAFYGLIPASRKVETYNHTFHGLPRAVLRRRAVALGVPTQMRSVLRRSYALGMLLLGDDYLEAAALDENVTLGGPTLCFCAPAVARRLPRLPQLKVLPLDNRDAQRFSCGLIALKGELGARLLQSLAAAPETIELFVSSDTDVLSELARRTQAAAAAA